MGGCAGVNTGETGKIILRVKFAKKGSVSFDKNCSVTAGFRFFEAW